MSYLHACDGSVFSRSRASVHMLSCMKLQEDRMKAATEMQMATNTAPGNLTQECMTMMACLDAVVDAIAGNDASVQVHQEADTAEQRQQALWCIPPG